MDLAYYPNIAAKADELGGVKKTMFNKKLLEQADASWRQFSSEEIARIEQEAPSAVKVGNCFVTPTAILHMGRNQHALFAIPVRDVIWIYGNVTTTRMYYIFPVSKLFQVQLLTRSNQTYTLASISTGPFTRKDHCGDIIRQLQPLLQPHRKGIIFGWSQDIANYVQGNFQAAVAMVDEKSAE